MPIPQTTRVNPLDLQKNIAIGVSLPFNGLSGPFNKTYSTKEQTKSNLINLILTNKGERLFNPEYGSDLKRILFDDITIINKEFGLEDDLSIIINNIIENCIRIWMPEIQLINIQTKYPKENSVYITINYVLITE
jgi:phage baseplate assembly protein W